MGLVRLGMPSVRKADSYRAKLHRPATNLAGLNLTIYSNSVMTWRAGGKVRVMYVCTGWAGAGVSAGAKSKSFSKGRIGTSIFFNPPSPLALLTLWPSSYSASTFIPSALSSYVAASPKITWKAAGTNAHKKLAGGNFKPPSRRYVCATN